MKNPECCGKDMAKDGFAGSGRQRYRCRLCGVKTTGVNQNDAGYDKAEAGDNAARLRERIKSGCRRFVITAAQNNTKVHMPFFRSLLTYCEVNDAELVVIPIHYKNISLFTAGQEYKKWWSGELTPYLVDENVHLGGRVEIAGDTKIAATAANPLSGLQEVGGKRWQIIGHSQMGMIPVAAPVGSIPKRIYSTGAVTVRNYSRSKEGKKAEFHHSFSAQVVEIGGPSPFVRQLGFSKGGIYDIAGGELRLYTPDGVEDGGRALVLTTGDEHVKFHHKGVFQATYAPGGLCDVLRPQYLVRHDVLDGYAGSHHHEKDPLKLFKKHHSGDNCYRTEMEQVVAFLNQTTPPDCVNVMVDSNHHDHLQQFLNRANANTDHTNAIFIAEMQAAQREAVLAGEDARPLRLYCEPRLSVETLWLDRVTPFIKGNVDYGQHGDVGINGARGSAASMARAVHKAVIGHGHSAQIVKGVYQVGKSAVVMEYERGLSTHSHTHCVQYANGKRSLVDIFGGQYRI